MKKEYWQGRIHVREATGNDAIAVAENLREADQKEIWSAFRLQPLEGCLRSVRVSEKAFAIELDKKVVAIFGVSILSLFDRSGIIWLLGTDDILKIAVTFEKYTRPFLKEFLQEWNSLENWVHGENVISLKWLKRAGFTIGDPKPFGLDQELFHKIELRRK